MRVCVLYVCDVCIFLQETLEQVRHTKVRCVPVEKLEALPEKNFLTGKSMWRACAATEL